jgi:NTP pyrophosphatase (non-canonical NTP hydrolase)
MIDFNTLANTIYLANKDKGFWDKERNVGEMLMLVTSELGEAMEAHRKGKFASFSKFDKDLNFHKGFKTSFENNVKDTFEDEIADSIIRLLDMAGGMNIDLNFHITNKLKYNQTREKLHGKQY